MRSVLFAASASVALAGTATAQDMGAPEGGPRPQYDQQYSGDDTLYRVPVDGAGAVQICRKEYDRAVEDGTAGDRPPDLYVQDCVQRITDAGEGRSYRYNERYGRYYYRGEPSWGESPWNDPYRNSTDPWRRP
jgi:hypothetical protein